MLAATCLPLLLVSAALLPAEGLHRRCTEVSGGNLSGKVYAPDPMMLSPGERRHTIPITHEDGCEPGVVVTVCDVLPPEVVLDEDDLSSARLLRLGPTWLPLLVELTVFCSPEPETSPTERYTPTLATGAP